MGAWPTMENVPSQLSECSHNMKHIDENAAKARTNVDIVDWLLSWQRIHEYRTYRMYVALATSDSQYLINIFLISNHPSYFIK